MTNCTVSGNFTTSDNGGGIYNESVLTLTNVTVTDNRVYGWSDGSGLWCVGGSATIVNTIIAGNTWPNSAATEKRP
jgi:hypothetical protein